MIYRTSVHSTERPEELHKDIDTVYIRSNITATEDGFKYNEIEMSYDEYATMAAEEAQQDISTLGTTFAEYQAQVDVAIAELSILIGGGANV